MNKYITSDEYLAAKGIDLKLELQDDDNSSTKVERFIHDVTDYCVDTLIRQGFGGAVDLLNWDSLPEVRQNYFRQGVMEQIDYVLRNGKLTLNAGINLDTGVITNFDDVKMYEYARTKFWMGGFANVRTDRRGW